MLVGQNHFEPYPWTTAAWLVKECCRNRYDEVKAEWDLMARTIIHWWI